MDGQGKVGGALTALLLLLPAIASADTIIETEGSGSHAAVLYVSDDKVRVESSADRATVTLFDRAAGELVFIDHSTRQFQRVDRTQMREIARRIQRTRDQVERQLEELPPEQRKRMREELSERPFAAAGIEVERGDSRTIAGIGCQEAMVHLNGEPSHAVCVAPPQNLGLSGPAFRTLDEMFAFFGEMTAGLSEGRGELGPRTTSHVINALNGIPVRSEAVESGSSWTVTAVHERAIEPEQFRVPADYEEVDPLAKQ